MKKVLSLILIAMLTVPAMADHCNQLQVIQQQQLVATPFVVPVGVPVSPQIAAGVNYQYNASTAELQQLRKELAEIKAQLVKASSTNSSKGNSPKTLQVSALSQNCAKCHSGTKPKGDFLISERMTPDARLKAIEALVTGQMPPKKQLDVQTNGRIMLELSRMSKAKK